MKHFCVFGTHPRLSLAELRACHPKMEQPTLCGSAALIELDEWDGTVLMNRLGGTVKLGDVMYEKPLTEWKIEDVLDVFLQKPRAERIIFGWTVYGGSSSQRQRLQKEAIELKRQLIQQGHPARWVTSENNQPLSPAAVAKLDLTGEGYDVAIFIHGDHVSLGLTTHVQQADDWSLRDYGRPIRDDENGMLPPKLARMLVNLAGVPIHGTLIDPFCGSGTILMEAALATQADHILGSDIEDKQVQDTQHNLEWLIKKNILRAQDEQRFHLFKADARQLEKALAQQARTMTIDRVVTEGTLGPPLRGQEPQTELDHATRLITNTWIETLTSLSSVLTSGARLVIIWPSFKTTRGTARVDLSAHPLLQSSYRLVHPLQDWEHDTDPILYHRPGQRVMRRVVVLDRL